MVLKIYHTYIGRIQIIHVIRIQGGYEMRCNVIWYVVDLMLPQPLRSSLGLY